MGTDWRVEERLREKLALLSQELSETLAAPDAVRADLAASEKAREEAERERDRYRASAELRVGMRREFEALLGVGDTMDTGTFEAGLARLRALLAAETRVEEMFADREASAVAWNRICGNMKWRAEHAEKERSAAVQRALAAESRAARLEFQIEREIIFLEEEAATGVSFYEATFTNRAQELRAVIAAEEGK